MMAKVGVRELKNEAEAERAAEAAEPGEDIWAELEAIRQEIGRAWKSPKTGVELVSEQRR